MTQCQDWKNGKARKSEKDIFLSVKKRQTCVENAFQNSLRNETEPDVTGFSALERRCEEGANIVFLGAGTAPVPKCSKEEGFIRPAANYRRPQSSQRHARCFESDLKVIFLPQNMSDHLTNVQERNLSSLSARPSLSKEAMKKRSAWTAATSNRQLRLSNTSEESARTLSSTESGCVLRPAPGTSFERDATSGRSLSQDKDSNNLLKVPLPSGSKSPYSTSPSTDEGIVTDEHHPDEKLSPSKTVFVSQEMDSSRTSTVRIVKARELRPGRRRLPSTKDLNGNQREARRREAVGDDFDRNNNSGNNSFVPLLKNSSQRENDLRKAFCGQPHDQQDSVTDKRLAYVKRGPSVSDTTGQTSRAGRHLQMGAAHAGSRIRQQQQQHPVRQASVGSAPKRKEVPNSWRRTPSTSYARSGSSDEDDNPVILYSRPPGHARPVDSCTFSLFDHNDQPQHKSAVSENAKRHVKVETPSEVTHEQTPTRRPQIKAGESSEQAKPTTASPLKTTAVGVERQVSLTRQISEPSRSDSTPGMLSSGSVSRKDAISRSGSVKSALADAVSHVVGATSSRNLLPRNNMTPKEKQQTLSERLMTVGPSDPRRVQSIVEDILCEMGEERLVQYKNAFAKFDKDSSGIISSKQLRRLLRTLGHNPSDIELRELVNQVDMDENGKIDFNEFIIMIGYFDKANNEDEDLCDIFRVFDHEEKGSIDVNELRNIWNDFLSGMAPIEEFEEMINFIDNDGNGEINRVELLEMLSMR